jgi:hypothetical protein
MLSALAMRLDFERPTLYRHLARNLGITARRMRVLCVGWGLKDDIFYHTARNLSHCTQIASTLMLPSTPSAALRLQNHPIDMGNELINGRRHKRIFERAACPVIAPQLPTPPARPCTRGTKCAALKKCGAREALAVWTQRRPHVKSVRQYLPRALRFED